MESRRTNASLCSDAKSKNKGAQGRPFPKRPLVCKISQAAWDKIEEVFHKMDPDGSNAVTKEEARNFFKGAFGKISADAMFNEVDVDGSGAIDADEFVNFWLHGRKNGYKEQDILDELDELLEGGAWVDWKDGRSTADNGGQSFPKRPVLCRINQATWDKCRDLFMKIDHDRSSIINHDKAMKHFKGAFNKVSVEAMFNEIDQNHHGQITPKEWMKFWVQVRWSGYSNKDLTEELDSLMEGNAWCDWKDGRSTA
jgi:Ca2+-binding EF-hand superfamily protein